MTTAKEHINPEARPGDTIQIGIELTSGEIMWGSVQTVDRLAPTGEPYYRPKWAKVDKRAEHWRMPIERETEVEG